MLRAWRGEHGNWCPGDHRGAHRASDLTVDHVVPLAAGGAPFDIGNTAVLLRQQRDAVTERTAAGPPAERALEWLRALGESLQAPESRLHHLAVGAAHARQRVLAIVDEHEVTVAALDTGEVLSSHLIEPDRRYWRNQRRDPGRWPGSPATG